MPSPGLHQDANDVAGGYVLAQLGTSSVSMTDSSCRVLAASWVGAQVLTVQVHDRVECSERAARHCQLAFTFAIDAVMSCRGRIRLLGVDAEILDRLLDDRRVHLAVASSADSVARTMKRASTSKKSRSDGAASLRPKPSVPSDASCRGSQRSIASGSAFR